MGWFDTIFAWASTTWWGTALLSLIGYLALVTLGPRFLAWLRLPLDTLSGIVRGTRTRRLEVRVGKDWVSYRGNTPEEYQDELDSLSKYSASAEDDPVMEVRVASNGRLYFNLPRIFIVHKNVTVTARITLETPSDAEDQRIADDLEGGPGEVRRKDIPTTAVMSAQIYGDDDVFVIHPRSEIQRLLAHPNAKGFGEWRWLVRAVKSGDYELILQINGYAPAPDGQLVAPVGLDPIRTRVRVRRNLVRTFKNAARAVAVLLLGAAVTAIVTTHYDMRVRKKSEPDTMTRPNPPATVAPGTPGAPTPSLPSQR